MLSVRVDGREVEATPLALARLVLDGRVDRDSPSKTSGATSEQSLEQSVGTSYGEALTGELLHRIRSMYSPQSPADLQNLRLRVEDLCQWRWASPHVAARLLWTAAWLNELMERIESAVGYYDAFLQTSCREAHLRLLAYNNRGVLRIRLGRLEGVEDLLRAAIPHELSAGESACTSGLPSACFNLLNLLNISFSVASLVEAVDEMLADFFSRLPEESRTFWLGPTPVRDDSDGQISRHASEGTTLRIVRDDSCRRVNTLAVRLAAQARQLNAGEARLDKKPPSAGADQLCLWECPVEGFGGDGNGEKTVRAVSTSTDRYAEAASLLLSDDVPATLVRTDSPLNQAEQLAYEELADVEGRLAIHQRELTRSRLQVQRRILSSLNRRGRLAAVLARVDAQLERVARLEAQDRQLGFQKACGRLVAEVEQFCRISDPCLAERRLHDLSRQLEDFQAQSGPQTDREVRVLLDELTQRVERHMRRLKRLEIRRRIRPSLRYIRRNWPSDWTVPVPESVYQAVAQCHVNDPEGWIEDWADLRAQLDAHQAQYHARRALSVLQTGGAAWDAVEEDLVEGLCLQPELWLTVAALFGLAPAAETHASGSKPPEMWESLRDAAVRLFDAVARDGEPEEADRDRRLMHRAGQLLGRTFEHIGTDTRRALDLWRHVEATLRPVLMRATVETVSHVRILAEECLDRWPMGSLGVPGRADPRHPVNLFLESCEKTRRLVEAEQWLHARPPRLDLAAQRYTELLEAGPHSPAELKRILTGLYLAQIGQTEVPAVQREVLTRLEAWIEARPAGTGRGDDPQELRAEIDRIRSAVAATQTLPGAVNHGSRGGRSNTEDGPEKDHGNPEQKRNPPE